MNEEIRPRDLFSGIGGFSLGLERAGPIRTVAFCEQDTYAQRVLKKHWPEVPIYDDVRTIDTDGLGRIDLICGGFPCQPWSVAGQQRGAEDDRDLWPSMVALIEDLRPQWVIGENVRGFINQPMGLQRSLSDLESIGYSAVPFIIPACAVDAPHRRDRVWIVARNTNSGNVRKIQQVCAENVESSRICKGTGASTTQDDTDADGQSEPDGTQHEKPILADADNTDGRRGAQRRQSGNGEPLLHGEVGATVADASRQGLSIPQRETAPRTPARQDNVGRTATECRRWLSEPNVGRVAHGVSSRVDRLKCLGNAVVPQVVEQIGRAILEGHRR